MSEAKKPLILIIDIDDDIGSVTGKSLLVGIDEIKKIALDFAIKRPEDADTNAIFAGLNLYESLKSSSNDPEIAIIGGHPTNSMLAQTIIKDRTKQILDRLENKNVELYLVSDGTDELLVAEVLRDLAPVAGLKRVIVEQHLGVEGSYFLLARYLRKAIDDPRYSKYFLGVPGVLIALFGILSVFGYIYFALKIVLAVAGVFLIIKGFNIENRTFLALKNFANYIRETSHFQVAGLGLLLVSLFASIFAGYYSVINKSLLIVRTGSILENSLPVLFIGFILYIVIARIFYKVTRSNFNILRETAQIVVLISLAFSFYRLGLSLINIGPKLSVITGYDIVAIFIGSGFLLYVVMGAGIASLIELADYLHFKCGKKSS